MRVQHVDREFRPVQMRQRGEEFQLPDLPLCLAIVGLGLGNGALAIL